MEEPVAVPASLHLSPVHGRTGRIVGPARRPLMQHLSVWRRARQRSQRSHVEASGDLAI